MDNLFDQYNQTKQQQYPQQAQVQPVELGPENDYRQAMSLLNGSIGGGGAGWQTPNVDYSPMNWQSYSKGDDSGGGGGGGMSSLGSIASMFA